MAAESAKRQGRLRALRRAASSKADIRDGGTALLKLLRGYHRAGAAIAARQTQKDGAHEPETAQLAGEALAAFDQAPLSLSKLLGILRDDGRRRWTNFFAQVSDTHLARTLRRAARLKSAKTGSRPAATVRPGARRR